MGEVTLTFRRMSPEDVPAVAALEVEVFTDPWSAGAFAEEVSLPDRVYLVAEEDGDVLVGYAGLLVVAGDAHVTTMAVAEHRRSDRVGTRLMLRLTEEALGAGAGHLTLEVRASNTTAQHLYRTFGFEDVGVRKHYYRDEDALIMWAIDIGTIEYRDRLDDIARSVA
ncbi:ribosomal protein S18-alanine N-acetyltransferase [bacterium]|nr:ribosomal protein S18-alanine N-acetyltransferase [bacterium]